MGSQFSTFKSFLIKEGGEAGIYASAFVLLEDQESPLLTESYIICKEPGQLTASQDSEKPVTWP
jgi:hypothetical protein